MKNTKRLLAILLVVSMVFVLLTGCGQKDEEENNYYSVIAKGFQHQFWQVVKAGSEQAATDLGVEIYFTGPEGERGQDAHGEVEGAVGL